MKSILKEYVFEACKVEDLGLKVKLKNTIEYKLPEEFQSKLIENPALKTAFELLTPGRQRAYILYFSQPKQSKTKIARIEKFKEQILMGKGLLD